MTLTIHLKIVGALLLALAAANPLFARRFGWRRDLASVPLLTRQVFFVHCFFIVLVLVMMGGMALACTDALLAPSSLARVVLAGLTIFWLARLFVQCFVYDRRLWRGSPARTAAHYLFTMLWTYYALVFGWAAHLQWMS